jgi:hypothetical protein
MLRISAVRRRSRQQPDQSNAAHKNHSGSRADNVEDVARKMRGAWPESEGQIMSGYDPDGLA